MRFNFLFLTTVFLFSFSPDIMSQGGGFGHYEPIKYSNPYMPWAQTFNHTKNKEDVAMALAVSPDGSIWVTGRVQNRSSGFDIVTVVYDPDGGTINDTNRFNGTGHGNDIPIDILFDKDSYCLVTGQTWGFGSAEDYLILKYDYSGEILWHWSYDGRFGARDIPAEMAIDSSNTIVITGSSKTRPDEGLDYCTIKMHSSSQPVLWESVYSGSGGGDDFAKSITCDSKNNIIVTGFSFEGFQREYDMTTIKYDSLGNHKWTRRFNGGASQGDYGVKVIADSGDNAVVSGHSRTGSSNRDYMIVKYKPDGSQAWTYNYNGPVYKEDYASDMALDINDNIYVTGRSRGLGDDFDFATLKLDPDGNLMWVHRYSSFWKSDDEAIAIVLDDSANVYVTGTSFDPFEGSTDIITLMYDTEGVLQWIRTYNGQGKDEPTGMAYDALEGLYIGGATFHSTVNDTDYLTIKYLP